MQVEDQIHNANLPKLQDLRQEQSGCFTPVMNQGNCGSCWAFAVANTVSDAFSIQKAKANGVGSCAKQIDMSEEELIMCSTATDWANGQKCEGGQINLALDQVAAKGISTEKCNPQGHGAGHDSLGQGACPTQCKGTGDIDNRATPTGFEANPVECVDSDNGATDDQNDGCAAYTQSPSWCGNYNNDTFKSDEMCCACKSSNGNTTQVNLKTTAEIQSQLVKYGPMTVGMPVQNQFQNVGTGIYRPEANQSNPGGHAVECVGWGHDENDEGFWIIKNSWGCNWGDAGFFKQSWKFNSESQFEGLHMDGAAAFSNDIPLSEEPECKVPEDSNNSDHCAQYSEFDTCKLCNSGYELLSDGTCKLKDEGIDEEKEDPIDDGEPVVEDIFWQECTNSSGIKGYLCPADLDPECQFLEDNSVVECSTWLEMAAENNVTSNCSLCAAPAPIDFCANQAGETCLECNPGYSLNEHQYKCLADACAAGEESTARGDCVVPVPDCAPGSTHKTTSGNLICKLCNPGFKIDSGNCQALPNPENCAEVEMSNPERICKVCNVGQYSGPDGQCLEEEATCQDTDNGAVDPYGDGCAAYTNNPSWCGNYDDADFKSKQMCCICMPQPIQPLKCELDEWCTFDNVDYAGETTEFWKQVTFTEAFVGKEGGNQLSLTLKGKDQGWGNKKSQFAVSVDTLGTAFTVPEIGEWATFTQEGMLGAQVSPILDHDWKTYEPDLSELSSYMNEPSKKYTLRFWTKAGGGGGHEIHLKDIKGVLWSK